jgi:hypothetical protein
MKIKDKTLKAVADYYGISTVGKLRNMIKDMNLNAAVYYFDNAKLKHIRVGEIHRMLTTNN